MFANRSFKVDYQPGSGTAKDVKNATLHSHLPPRAVSLYAPRSNYNGRGGCARPTTLLRFFGHIRKGGRKRGRRPLLPALRHASRSEDDRPAVLAVQPYLAAPKSIATIERRYVRAVRVRHGAVRKRTCVFLSRRYRQVTRAPYVNGRWRSGGRGRGGERDRSDQGREGNAVCVHTFVEA